MRLMLGNERPELLVEVDGEFKENYFRFWVINGMWTGEFRNGDIIVNVFDHWPEYALVHYKILCRDQNRLDCCLADYQTVFDNFHDPNWIAPKFESKIEDIDPDSIAF
jgi:hypothetical protein